MTNPDHLKKLENIRTAGHNPYPDRFERTHKLTEAKKLPDGEKNIALAGRLMTLRTMGKLAFAHLQDFSDKMQIAFTVDKLGKEDFKFWTKNIDHLPACYNQLKTISYSWISVIFAC